MCVPGSTWQHNGCDTSFRDTQTETKELWDVEETKLRGLGDVDSLWKQHGKSLCLSSVLATCVFFFCSRVPFDSSPCHASPNELNSGQVQEDIINSTNVKIAPSPSPQHHKFWSRPNPDQGDLILAVSLMTPENNTIVLTWPWPSLRNPQDYPICGKTHSPKVQFNWDYPSSMFVFLQVWLAESIIDPKISPIYSNTLYPITVYIIYSIWRIIPLISMNIIYIYPIILFGYTRYHLHIIPTAFPPAPAHHPPTNSLPWLRSSPAQPPAPECVIPCLAWLAGGPERNASRGAGNMPKRCVGVLWGQSQWCSAKKCETS